MAALCPSCRSPLSPTPGGAALQCPRCHSGAGVGTTPGGPNSTADYRPEAALTVTRKGPSDAPADAGFLEPAQRPDEIGRLGPYRVLARVGAGGMGVVYRAEDAAIGRAVALKVMLPAFAADPKWRVRFLREARAQAKVEHENVVPIYDVGEHAGVAFLTMPLLKGQSLSAALRQTRLPPLREALRIAREVAQGLAAAHGVGLIHRDVKPGNVWLEGDRRRVKLLDFGLARAADPHAAQASVNITLTVQGAAVGTPAYMSPEQAKGEAVDPRTDLYSLGVMLYQMTAGRMPYRGSTALELLIAAETEPLAPPSAVNPDVPPAVADLVMRLMARHPDDRPPSAEAVADELRALEAAAAAGVDRPDTPAPAPNDPWHDLDADDSTEVATAARTQTDEAPAAKKWPLLVAATAAGVLVLVAGAVALRPEQETPAPPPPIATKQKEREKDKDRDKDKEKDREKEKDAGREPPPLPVLAGLTPALRLDYAAGFPADGPPAAKDPDGRYEWGPVAGAMNFRTRDGLWWARAGGVTQSAAIEVRARVVSRTGAWAFNPIGYRSPVADNSFAGVVVAVNHAGVLTVNERRTGRPEEIPPRSYSPKSIKSGKEWNTVLVVVRDDRMDIYANGEKVDEGVALWPVPQKMLLFGTRSPSSGVAAEVEYERVTVWELPATPKK